MAVVKKPAPQTTYNPLSGVFTPIPPAAAVPSTAALGWTPAGGGQTLAPGAVANTNVSTPIAQQAMAAAAAAPAATQQAQPEAPYVPPTDAVPTVDPWAGKQSAYDRLYSQFARWGIDVDGTGLAGQIKQWILDGKSDEGIVTDFRGSAAYAKRFTGMADLVKRGQAMAEGDYINLERSYAGVMRQWGLPAGFYDDPTDFGRFIANGVSVKEVDDRIKSAKTFLDEGSDPSYRRALNDLGVSDGALLAHMVDGDRAQSIIQKEIKQAAFGGAAAKFGFNLTLADQQRWGGTLGDQFNSFGVDQRNELEKTLSGVADISRTQARLAAIDHEAYTSTDSLNAELGNDSAAKLASQKRAEREVARFSGSSGFGAAALQHAAR